LHILLKIDPIVFMNSIPIIFSSLTMPPASTSRIIPTSLSIATSSSTPYELYSLYRILNDPAHI